MRRATIVLLCGAVLAGCAKKDQAAAGDTAGATAAAATTPAPGATVSLGDFAGDWTGRAMPADRDTTLTTFEIHATADTTGWTQTFPNQPPVPMRVTSVAGDSIMLETGPYPSAVRPGETVSVHSILRKQGDKIIGVHHARYSTKPDSVVTLRSESTKKQ